MRTVMDPKTRRTKIAMLSCLQHNSFPIHKPPPNPPFQQHFCGKIPSVLLSHEILNAPWFTCLKLLY